MKVVEAEFAFKLLNDLNPKHSKYTEEEVLKNDFLNYHANYLLQL